MGNEARPAGCEHYADLARRHRTTSRGLSPDAVQTQSVHGPVRRITAECLLGQRLDGRGTSSHRSADLGYERHAPDSPSPSPGASRPSLNTTSPRISSPSTGTRGPGTSTSPTARRLCDTKVESANPVLRGVRFGRHDTFDRLAFDFCKPADTTLKATVVKQLTEDASGDKVTLQGRYFYAITLTPADAHDTAGRATVPNQTVTVAGNYMQQYKLIGDFEGVVTYGLGVRRLAQTAGGIQSDPNDPRHIVLYFDLGPQTDPDGQE